LGWFGSSCGKVISIPGGHNSDRSHYRLNIVKTLTALSGNNRPISDTEILKWANAKVSSKPGAKTVRSFKDPSISTGVWFLDLLDALKPGIVDYSMVAKDASDYESKRQNGWSISLDGSKLVLTVPCS
jgi:Calponin homology (CH) domain